jgi:CRP-like cAMP-binding protein
MTDECEPAANRRRVPPSRTAGSVLEIAGQAEARTESVRSAGVYDGAVVARRPRWEHPAQRSLWHSLDVAEREAFNRAAHEGVFWAGSVLCRQDDTATDVVVIKSGWTKVTMDVDGQRKIVALRGPGDVVGEQAVLMDTARSATVVAMDDVRASVIPADRFRKLLADHPRVLQVLKRQASERLAESAAAGLCDDPAVVERRLAGLLLELAIRRGGYEPDGSVTITLPISPPELADWVDAGPDAVAWYLASWQQLGIIRVAQHRVTVVDAVGLEKICGAIAPSRISPARISVLGSNPSAPLNCSIFFTDVAGFADPRRDDGDRRVVRDALYRILRDAFEGSNVPWSSCVHEDRGDGILTVAPPTVSTVSLVEPLLALLASKLKRYNRQAGEPVRIQLRCALQVGPVVHDLQGLCGQSLIYAARMLDAPVMKESLESTGADLAFMASAHVYETVICQASGLVDPAEFRSVRFRVKEAEITSWMYLAGQS